MRKLFLYLSITLLLYACMTRRTYKYMETKVVKNPVTTEAIVTLALYENSWDLDIWTEYAYKDHNDSIHYFSTRITSTHIDVVKGERFMITYDSLNPADIIFDETQCGPFFHPYEQVDTTVGKIILAKYYGTEKKWIDFVYTYQAKDSVFQKRVKCSDTSTFANIATGRQHKVIYDPRNKGRAKMLFEPKYVTK